MSRRRTLNLFQAFFVKDLKIYFYNKHPQNWEFWFVVILRRFPYIGLHGVDDTMTGVGVVIELEWI